MSGTLICFLDTNYGKYWGKGALGKKYNLHIKGINFTLHFPELPKDVYSFCPLDPPSIVNGYAWKAGEGICYGHCMYSPDGYSIIEKIVVTAEVDNKEKAKRLSEEFEKQATIYAERFFKYVSILGNSIEPISRARKTNLAQYVYESNKKSEPINPTRRQIIDAYVMNGKQNFPGKKIVELAVSLLEKDIPVPGEYDYYLEAIEAYEIDDCRKCVLDAATAAEICVTNEIRRILKEKGPDWKIDKILDNYQGLVKKYKFLKQIGGKTENICIDSIAVPRNRAIHAGAEIKAQDANTSLTESRKVLERFSKFW